MLQDIWTPAMRFAIFVGVIQLLSGNAIAKPLNSYPPDLPIVELGYERHQAIAYNQTHKYYNFSNIPYAAPPVDELRFKKPQHPAMSKNDVPNKGEFPKICPQGEPHWTNITAAFAKAYVNLVQNHKTNDLEGLKILPSQDLKPFSFLPAEGEGEDCLYLDVIVPEAIFNAGSKAKAPVLVHIHGGGYVSGDKVTVGLGMDGHGSPAGLLKRSNNSIIYVALNYRLGAFGWLAGPTFESQGGHPNVGLLDQRMALDWVQQYIHLFGGDAHEVTLLGESAGGGSIEHQIVAYGGKIHKSPFRRAIPQSPAFLPIRDKMSSESIFRAFLDYAGVSSLQQLQQLDTRTLMSASAKQIFDTESTASYTYGPVVDGGFVPELPGALLASKAFNQNVSILAGHNSREGALLTDPQLRNDSAILAQLVKFFGEDQEHDHEYIVERLYPAVYNGSQPYANWYERASLIISESAFICNNFYMLSATKSHSYGYLFDIFPSLHVQDTSYTMFQGFVNQSDPTSVQFADVALTLQDWIISFAKGQVPASTLSTSQNLPLYGAGAQIGSLSKGNAESVCSTIFMTDPAANERCQWWQQWQLTTTA